MCSGARFASAPPTASRRRRTSIRVVGANARGSANQSPRAQRRLVNARQIQGAALARRPDFGVAILRMNAAHPHERAGRHHRERVSDLHSACPRGTGRHRPASRQRKDAIDCQPKQTLFRALRPARRRRMQMRAQCGDARVIGHRRGEGKERRIGECRGSQAAPRSAPAPRRCAHHPPDRSWSRRSRRA